MHALQLLYSTDDFGYKTRLYTTTTEKWYADMVLEDFWSETSIGIRTKTASRTAKEAETKAADEVLRQL